MNAQPLAAVQRAVLHRVATAPAVFVFLDYDGTLAPLAPTPEQAVPLPGTWQLLRQLAEGPDVKVAVVTGRTVANVRASFNVPGIYYVGIHGLEVRGPDGETHTTADADALAALMPAIKQRVMDGVDGRPGIMIEDKGAALACHYRLASHPDAIAGRQIMEAVVQEYRQRGVPIRLTFGHEVAEARLTHVDKGHTVCALLQTLGSSALAIYAGDDQTDEEAFKLLPRDAITIAVGALHEPTIARYRASGPSEVQNFLRGVLAARLNGRRTVASNGAYP